MNERTAAEERLLDLALEEVLTPRPAAATQPAAPRGRRALLAALFVLGAGVVTMLARDLAGPRAPSAVLQEPQASPLPAASVAHTAEDLARLPPTTLNLELHLDAPEPLRGLARFRDLRRLDLRSAQAGTGPLWPWLAAEPAALDPLDSLSALEELHLPHGAPLRASHLRSLIRLPLRTLTFGGVDLRDADLAAALVALPHLRDLRLQMVVVDAALFEALLPLDLQRLSMSACPGLDAGAWAAIARFAGLRWLDVACQGESGCTIAGEYHRLAPLDEVGMRAISGLGRLQHLGLDETEFSDELLPLLPDQLTSLDLGDRVTSGGAATALRRLEHLRELTFGCGLDDDAAAGLLKTLTLRRLDYRATYYGAELLRTLAGQPALESLSLKLQRRVDLALLAPAPKLACLELRAAPASYQPGIADLAPLRTCRALRSLRLAGCDLTPAALATALGDRITVEFRTGP